jgi:TetR/AcrR family transcriptional regulator
MASRMKGTDRRRQLLEASIRCFAEYGYKGTTTARLAKAAGVTEPVLYKHFASKRDLFVALLEQVGREVMREWRRAIAPLDSPLEQLRVLLRMNPAIADPRAGQLYRVIFAAQAEVNEPEIRAALREHYQQYAEFLTNLIKRAQTRHQVRRDVLAPGLAWQLIHAGIGFALIDPLSMPGHATPGIVEQTIALLMEILSGERSSAISRGKDSIPP